ncbi:MAG: glycosyltransferase family 9 protein [Planctomycetota bacterium]|nr:glycosyltransferase family 9 protein [Planctomycetota bacterium]
MQPPKRILIVRLSAIGDCIHGLPVACRIRDAWPDTHISWVVEGRTAELLRDHPAIDQLVQVPRKWLKSPRTVLQLRRQLREIRPEVALDLQGLSKSAVVARLSGAKARIGFTAPDGREISRWLNNTLVEASAPHVVDRYLELLSPLEVPDCEVRFGLPEFTAENASIDQFVKNAKLEAGFAIINVGAGWPSKRWPTERLAEVSRHLAKKQGLPAVIVWAGADEQKSAEQIVTMVGTGAVLAPRTTLRELAALTRRSRFFVSSDTGPLHLAAAVGTSCIGLFGPMSAMRNGPYGQQHISIQNICLSGSSRSKRTADDASMRAISVAEVCAACDQLIERTGGTAAKAIVAA